MRDRVVRCGRTEAYDLSNGVHGSSLGVQTTQGAKVDHSAGLGPRERTWCSNPEESPVADNLAAVADRDGNTHVAIESAQINHPAGLRPQERVHSSIVRGGAVPHDITVLVHR